METGDFEPANEFEFDLLDVDVAAFESVATEDVTQEQEQVQSQAEVQPQTQVQEPTQIPSQIQPPGEPPIQPQLTQLTSTTITTTTTTLQPQQNVPTTGVPTRILLVPINSKLVGFEHLIPTSQKAAEIKPVIKPAPPSVSSPRPPVPQIISAANEAPKRKPCNCTKSQCLKLYCDCFANGEFCSGCNCTNCSNSLSKEKERQKAISQCLERNPEAFRPKIGKLSIKLSDSIERRHTKGCNCKRSGCLKNYCECYEAKILCSNLCKCCGCKNYEESFERKSLMQLANSASEHARGILKNLLPTNNNSNNTGKEFTRSFITDKVIHASLVCLLQTAQQAEKDGTPPNNIPHLIQSEMGKCLRMIVDSATESSSQKKR